MENTIGSIVLATAGRDQESLFFVVGQRREFFSWPTASGAS